MSYILATELSSTQSDSVLGAEAVDRAIGGYMILLCCVACDLL
jgi:hypothetical protein